MSLSILRELRDESPVEVTRKFTLAQAITIGERAIPAFDLTISLPTEEEVDALKAKYALRGQQSAEGQEQQKAHRHAIGRLIVRGWEGCCRETMAQVSTWLCRRPQVLEQLPDGEIEFDPEGRDLFMEVLDEWILEQVFEAAQKTNAFAIEQVRAKKVALYVKFLCAETTPQQCDCRDEGTGNLVHADAADILWKWGSGSGAGAARSALSACSRGEHRLRPSCTHRARSLGWWGVVST
jgi:hypothetical protein